jgi:hypothetical protein
MATTVTLTIADADAPRVAKAAIAKGPYQPSPAGPGAQNSGASNAATIKTWLTNVIIAAVAQRESMDGAGGGAPPAIT